MNKFLLLFLFIHLKSAAQDDVIMLKKNYHTLHTWYSGQVLTLKINDDWITGYIKSIAHDSVYLRPFTTRVFGGGNTLAVVDTTFGITFPIAANQVQALPKEKGGSIFTNGTLIQLGAGGYLLLNVINTLSDNEPLFGSNNLPNVTIAAGVLAFGTLLHLSHKTEYKMGRKYKVAYLSLSK